MVTGSVTSHAMAIRDRIPYLNPAPEVAIVPAMPEITMCVVLTGKPVNPETFWLSLTEIAAEQRVSINHLLAQINADRQHANLSSAVRLYVLQDYRELAELALGAQLAGRRTQL